METLFALILTSCVLDVNHEAVCEPFQVELATTHAQCIMYKEAETPFLLEMERLDCDPVTYVKE